MSSYIRDGRERGKGDGKEKEGRYRSSPMVLVPLHPFLILSLPISSPLLSLGEFRGGNWPFKVDLVSNMKRSINLVDTVFPKNSTDFLRLKWDSYPQQNCAVFTKA